MKLEPKDSYDAMRSQYQGLRNIRARKRADAAELKAMGGDPRRDHAHVRRVSKLRAQLNGRNRRHIDRIMDNDDLRPIALVAWSPMPRSVRKYYDALIEAAAIDQCIDADQRMLADAR